VVAGVTAERPFNPGERNPEEHKRNEVGDDECAAAIGSCLHRESKKIAKTDCGTCNCEDDPEFGTPAFTIICHVLFLKFELKLSEYRAKFSYSSKNGNFEKYYAIPLISIFFWYICSSARLKTSSTLSPGL